MVAMGKLLEKTFVFYEGKEYKTNLESKLQAERQKCLEGVRSAISVCSFSSKRFYVCSAH